MSGPEASNQDPMQTQAVSMDVVRQAREAIAPVETSLEAPDAMQSRAISLDGLKMLRSQLRSIPSPKPAVGLEPAPTSQQVSQSVEAAAVRPAQPQQSEAARQTDIANADRQNREAASLPPRNMDLR